MDPRWIPCKAFYTELTDEGQEDEEGPQLDGIRVGQTLQLDPQLVQEAQCLFSGLHSAGDRESKRPQ